MKGYSSSRCGGRSMTSNAAARIQSATARGNGGQVSSGSFAARAQSVAAHNATSASTGGGNVKGGK